MTTGDPIRLDVRIEAAGARTYPVILQPGLLERLPVLVAELSPAPRYAIIADATVADLIAAPLRDAMEEAGHPSELVRFAAGEQHKNRDAWASLVDALAARGIGRDGCVIAVGGGVTGDLAGFAAASYMRGIALVQVPTSLLSMVDAAVGGKTGLDTPLGKNLIGAYHHPRAVLIDPRVLASLPAEHMRNGLAETVKHGAIADRSYLDWLGESAAALLERDEGALCGAIHRSLLIKTEVVAADPYEQGRRQVLNFGHTLGHALETWSGYRLLHGHAVSVGMVAEAALGETSGITEPGAADELRQILERLRLPVRPTGPVPAARILDLAGSDKKNRGGRIRYTLLRRLGEVACAQDGRHTHDVDDDVVVRILEKFWG